MDISFRPTRADTLAVWCLALWRRRWHHLLVVIVVWIVWLALWLPDTVDLDTTGHLLDIGLAALGYLATIAAVGALALLAGLAWALATVGRLGTLHVSTSADGLHVVSDHDDRLLPWRSLRSLSRQRAGITVEARHALYRVPIRGFASAAQAEQFSREIVRWLAASRRSGPSVSEAAVDDAQVEVDDVPVQARASIDGIRLGDHVAELRARASAGRHALAVLLVVGWFAFSVLVMPIIVSAHRQWRHAAQWALGFTAGGVWIALFTALAAVALPLTWWAAQRLTHGATRSEFLLRSTGLRSVTGDVVQGHVWRAVTRIRCSPLGVQFDRKHVLLMLVPRRAFDSTAAMAEFAATARRLRSEAGVDTMPTSTTTERLH